MPSGSAPVDAAQPQGRPLDGDRGVLLGELDDRPAGCDGTTPAPASTVALSRGEQNAPYMTGVPVSVVGGRAGGTSREHARGQVTGVAEASAGGSRRRSAGRGATVPDRQVCPVPATPRTPWCGRRPARAVGGGGCGRERGSYAIEAFRHVGVEGPGGPHGCPGVERRHRAVRPEGQWYAGCGQASERVGVRHRSPSRAAYMPSGPPHRPSNMGWTLARSPAGKGRRSPGRGHLDVLEPVPGAQQAVVAQRGLGRLEALAMASSAASPMQWKPAWRPASVQATTWSGTWSASGRRDRGVGAVGVRRPECGRARAEGAVGDRSPARPATPRRRAGRRRAARPSRRGAEADLGGGLRTVRSRTGADVGRGVLVEATMPGAAIRGRRRGPPRGAARGR